MASLTFWLPLEIYQMDTLGHPTFVVTLRFKNIVAFALGKMAAWGLTNDSMTYDPWDYVHITTWNFLPFLLRRVGVAPRWVVNVAFAVWHVALAATAWVLWRLRKVVRTGEFDDDADPDFARGQYPDDAPPATAENRLRKAQCRI